jgi:hypothetical protein
MKYLCLVYINEQRLAALPRPALDRLAADSAAYDSALQQRRCVLEARRLPSVQLATTVRPGGQSTNVPLITDGPYADTFEQLSGYMLIEAGDLDQAIRIAAQIPAGALGCVEIRPLGP